MHPDVTLTRPAATVLTVRLELEPSGPLRRAGRLAVALGLAAVEYVTGPDGEHTEPSVPGHLVVAYPDGTVVLRIPSHANDAELRAYVERQLAELTVGEFLERWGVRP